MKIKQETIDKLLSALNRAGRTVAQTALGMILVGSRVEEIDWLTVLSVSLVAGIVSLLTSYVGGMPEVKVDGVLVVDDREGIGYAIDAPAAFVPGKKTVRLAIDNTKSQK